MERKLPDGPVPRVRYTKFAQDRSLLILASLEELQASRPGELFKIEVRREMYETVMMVQMCLCRLPEQIGADAWLIDFHNHYDDQNKVRYAEFVLTFTKSERPVIAGDGREYHLHCLEVPERFFELI